MYVSGVYTSIWMCTQKWWFLSPPSWSTPRSVGGIAGPYRLVDAFRYTGRWLLVSSQTKITHTQISSAAVTHSSMTASTRWAPPHPIRLALSWCTPPARKPVSFYHPPTQEPILRHYIALTSSLASQANGCDSNSEILISFLVDHSTYFNILTHFIILTLHEK